MKRKIFVSILCAALFLGCKEVVNPSKSETAEIEVSKENIISKESTAGPTFTDLDGKPVELKDYKGKRVLLNFWATWCRPCIEEMPSLLKAEEALKEDNYVFLLASDQSMDKIKSFKQKKGFDFNYLKYNGSMADFKISALPATFIYNEKGEQIHRIDGATVWDTPKTLDKLKSLK